MDGLVDPSKSFFDNREVCGLGGAFPRSQLALALDDDDVFLVVMHGDKPPTRRPGRASGISCSTGGVGYVSWMEWAFRTVLDVILMVPNAPL